MHTDQWLVSYIACSFDQSNGPSGGSDERLNDHKPLKDDDVRLHATKAENGLAIHSQFHSH